MSPLPEPARTALVDAGARLAILFGSRAEGRASATSDWDLGVLLPPDADQDALVVRLERALGARVDLVDLRRASSMVCMEAVRRGVVALDASGSEFAAFASLSLRRYEDDRKLREAQQRSLAQFLAQRGLA